jgi:hypothetical protein
MVEKHVGAVVEGIYQPSNKSQRLQGHERPLTLKRSTSSRLTLMLPIPS